jgi:hypothetical protein
MKMRKEEVRKTVTDKQLNQTREERKRRKGGKEEMYGDRAQEFFVENGKNEKNWEEEEKWAQTGILIDQPTKRKEKKMRKEGEKKERKEKNVKKKKKEETRKKRKQEGKRIIEE